MIEFQTSMPSNRYKAYLKETGYDLYCGPILLVLGIKESDLYVLMNLLRAKIIVKNNPESLDNKK
jgi:hypothetical protein